MTQSLASLFSDADLERIRAATAAAEEKTSGEIVPYLVQRLDEHPEILYKGAAFGAVVASLVVGFVYTVGDFWGWTGAAGLSATLLGVVLGGALTRWAPLGRRLVDGSTMDQRVRLRAESAFLEEEVFRTRDRTGILILLGLWEHRAVILADEGIHRSVPEGEWQKLVDDLASGMAAGRATDALVEVIGRCGELLEQYGVERRDDDHDELSDAPRLRES